MLYDIELPSFLYSFGKNESHFSLHVFEILIVARCIFAHRVVKINF